MLNIYIIMLLAITGLAMFIYRDIMCPAVLQNIPWVISMVLLQFTGFNYTNNSFSYLYIVIGNLIFQVGFILVNNRNKLRMKIGKRKILFHANIFNIKLLIIFEAISLMYIYIALYKYVSRYFISNIFTTIKLGYNSNQISIPVIFSYFTNIITTMTICMFILYFYISDEDKKSYKKLLIIQILIGILNLIPATSRNSILLFSLSMMTVFILCKNINNKVTFKYLIRFFVIFMLFFSVFTFYKYFYLFEGKSKIQVIINQIAFYFSSSLVAFEKYYSYPNYYLYGKNTFGFFLSVFDKIFRSNYSISIVQDFIDIGQNASTNIYTFYHYYARDFGLFYALFVQLIIGIIHGISYKRLRDKSPLNIFIFSILMYPLIMQFFQDQYISILSNWIQIIITALLFFKTNMFLSKKNV